MTTRGRLLVLALASVWLLAAGAGAASAFEQTLISLGAVTFHTAISDVTCHITLQSTFVDWHELPIEGRRAGAITRAASSECAGATGVTFLSLPWEMVELRTLGTLPNLTGILVTIRSFSVNLEEVFGGLQCLYVGNQGLLIPIVELGNGEHSFGLAVLLGNTLRNSGNIFCPSEMRPRGTFDTTPLVPIVIT